MTLKSHLENPPVADMTLYDPRAEIWEGSIPADRPDYRELWDSLWNHSHATTAISTPEMTEQWCKDFADPDSLHTVVVEDRSPNGQGRLLASLPLMAAHHLPMTTVGDLPSDPWFQGTDLLLDESVLSMPPIGEASPMKLVLDQLVEGVRQLPWPILWFPNVRIETMRWRLLVWALKQAGLTVDVRDRYLSSQIRLAGDWSTFQSQLSRNMRSQMKRKWKKLAEQGEIDFCFNRLHTPDEVDRTMNLIFKIEDLGWKGRNGSSILKVEGIADFYRIVAHELASKDWLRTVTLHVAGRPIAAGFGYEVKNVLTLYKIGYDEEFTEFKPGMLLIHRLIEACHSDPSCEIIDFAGPIQDYHKRWKPTTYRVARLGVSLNRRGSMMLDGIRHCQSIFGKDEKYLKAGDLGNE